LIKPEQGSKTFSFINGSMVMVLIITIVFLKRITAAQNGSLILVIVL